MLNLLLVAVGGAAGSVLRYLVSGWCQPTPSGPGAAFPVGTLMVNAVGCFAIGYIMTLLTGLSSLRPEWRPLLVVGVLGGFTTFSAFGYETIDLLRQDAWGLAGLNVLAQNGVGFLLAFVGFRVAQLTHGLGWVR